ncbi:hypothetical protein G7B22_26005 [Blautia sp. MSK.20.9]|nr:hypothetical protein [Blautia sp. MSK.20.9]
MFIGSFFSSLLTYKTTLVSKTLQKISSLLIANCLINADFYGVRGIVIRKNTEKIIFENPGYSRTGKQQMRKGGISDPRNKILMKMFNLINIGERAGSGVPNVFNTWADQGWPEPIIEEEFDPDRTILILTIKKKRRTKTGSKKQAIKPFNI